MNSWLDVTLNEKHYNRSSLTQLVLKKTLITQIISIILGSRPVKKTIQSLKKTGPRKGGQSDGFKTNDPIVKATRAMLLALEFGWVKFTEKARFVPAFKYPEPLSDGKYVAVKVLTSGYTADIKNPFHTFKDNIPQNCKGKSELASLKKLNEKYHFSFQ